MELANIPLCKIFLFEPFKKYFAPGFAVVLFEDEDVSTYIVIGVSLSKSTPNNLSTLPLDNDIMLVIRITVVYKTKCKILFDLIVNLVFKKYLTCSFSSLTFPSNCGRYERAQNVLSPIGSTILCALRFGSYL